MSALRLIGLVCAAAELHDHEAIEAAIDGLNADEAEALLGVVAARMELHARQTGDWRPWAEIHRYARLPALREAATGFRARLDTEYNHRSDREQRTRRAQVDRAEFLLRRTVAPLLRRGASKAEIEEAAGVYADLLGWNRTFSVLVEELHRFRITPRSRYG